MTGDQMRLVSRNPQQQDELQKIVSVMMQKGWWKTQRTNGMQCAMGDVQHGPHLLRTISALALEDASPEEISALWQRFMNEGDRPEEQRGLKHWTKTVRPTACALVIGCAADHLQRRIEALERAVPPSPPDCGCFVFVWVPGPLCCVRCVRCCAFRGCVLGPCICVLERALCLTF